MTDMDGVGGGGISDDENGGGIMKNIGEFENRAIEIIERGRLPYEVVTGTIKPTKRIWREILNQAPIFNLLRNLNTMKRHGVFEDEVALEAVRKRLTDEETIRKSMILPFRFYSAHQAYEGIGDGISDALQKAMDISLANVPEIPGAVCIAPDVSGSMDMPISRRGTMKAGQIASVMAAAVYKANPNSIVLPFNNNVVRVSMDRQASVMTNAMEIQSHISGGTAMSTPVDLLIRENRKIDLIIVLTDNEEWEGSGYYGRGFLAAWHDYKQQVNPNAKALLIQLVSYDHRVKPADEPDVWMAYGWSESILKMASGIVKGQDAMIDEIRSVEL